MGYERYPRGRSQDDWNRGDTRYGRDDDEAAARDYGAGQAAGRDDRDEDAQSRILNRSFSGTY
jgi:hypothetical protein